MAELIYITITMPKGFKKLMDRYAKRLYMKRSEFIRMAVAKYIKHIDFLDKEQKN